MDIEFHPAHIQELLSGGMDVAATETNNAKSTIENEAGTSVTASGSGSDNKRDETSTVNQGNISQNDQTKSRISASNSVLNSPVPGLNLPNPIMHSSVPSLNSPNTSMNSSNPGLNSQNPSMNSPNTSMNSPNPGLNSQKPSMNSPLPEVILPKQGLNSSNLGPNSANQELNSPNVKEMKVKEEICEEDNKSGMMKYQSEAMTDARRNEIHPVRTCQKCGCPIPHKVTSPEHDGESPYLCTYCSLGTSHPASQPASNPDNALINGQSLTQAKPALVCSMCGNSYKQRTHLSRHKKSKHLKETKILPCSLCGENVEIYIFLDEDDSKVPSGENLRCKRCRGRGGHRHNENYRQQGLTCSICGLQATDTDSLNFHYQNTHSGLEQLHVERDLAKNYLCSICTLAFKDRWHLRRHVMRRHGKVITEELRRQHTCGGCDKVFFCKVELKEHYFQQHGVQDFIDKSGLTHRCQICTREFPSHYSLTRHQKNTHKINPDEIVKLGSQGGESLSYERVLEKCAFEPFVHECTFCRKMFRNTYSLNRHSRNVHKLATGPSEVRPKRRKKRNNELSGQTLKKDECAVSDSKRKCPSVKTMGGIKQEASSLSPYGLGTPPGGYNMTECPPRTNLCFLCNKDFDSNADLSNHITMHHKLQQETPTASQVLEASLPRSAGAYGMNETVARPPAQHFPGFYPQ